MEVPIGRRTRQNFRRFIFLVQVQFIALAIPAKGCTQERELASSDHKWGHWASDCRFVVTLPKDQYERTPHTPAITLVTSLHESVARVRLHLRTLRSGQFFGGLQITVRFGPTCGTGLGAHQLGSNGPFRRCRFSRRSSAGWCGRGGGPDSVPFGSIETACGPRHG